VKRGLHGGHASTFLNSHAGLADRPVRLPTTQPGEIRHVLDGFGHEGRSCAQRPDAAAFHDAGERPSAQISAAPRKVWVAQFDCAAVSATQSVASTWAVTESGTLGRKWVSASGFPSVERIRQRDLQPWADAEAAGAGFRPGVPQLAQWRFASCKHAPYLAVTAEIDTALAYSSDGATDYAERLVAELDDERAIRLRHDNAVQRIPREREPLFNARRRGHHLNS
jgi:hypothetical protein